MPAPSSRGTLAYFVVAPQEASAELEAELQSLATQSGFRLQDPASVAVARRAELPAVTDDALDEAAVDRLRQALGVTVFVLVRIEAPEQDPAMIVVRVASEQRVENRYSASPSSQVGTEVIALVQGLLESTVNLSAAHSEEPAEPERATGPSPIP